MKTLFTLLLLLPLVSFSQKTDEQVRQVLDTVILKSKEVSLYSKLVDWDSLEPKIYASAKGAKTVEELKPAFNILLNGLRDHHGTIRKLSDHSILSNFTDHKNKRLVDDREFKSEIWKVVNNTEAMFEYAILPNNIGYLKVVGISPAIDGQKEAERIRNAISELDKKKVSKWIIDLRYNGGGTINVMLAGLAPLLNTEKVASISNDAGNEQCIASVKKGNFWYCGVNAFQLKNKPKLKNPSIAILTSRWTVSSGELVAVAFKGQGKTKFFGEKTGGYTTNNGWEVINNEIILSISTGVYCDRNGNLYKEYVEPEVDITFEVESDTSKDKGILEAAKWLMEQ